jgi:sn-glycerol 3-phosphate transport system permease protein
LRGYQWYQSALIWPYAVAAPAAGVAFRFIFTPEAGLLGGLNKISPDFWNPSQNPVHAMILIILAYSWKYVAYNFIFLLAGLQSIPKPLIEASAIDGASVLRRVTDIQIPLLAPVIFFLLMINITDSFVDSFGIVDITTRGGPSKSTTLMVYKIYFDGFRGLDYSGAAAQSVILMFLIMTLTFVQFKWIEKRVHYG